MYIYVYIYIYVNGRELCELAGISDQVQLCVSCHMLCFRADTQLLCTMFSACTLSRLRRISGMDFPQTKGKPPNSSTGEVSVCVARIPRMRGLGIRGRSGLAVHSEATTKMKQLRYGCLA